MQEETENEQDDDSSVRLSDNSTDLSETFTSENSLKQSQRAAHLVTCLLWMLTVLLSRWTVLISTEHKKNGWWEINTLRFQTWKNISWIFLKSVWPGVNHMVQLV